MDKYRDIDRIPLVESRINHLLGRLQKNYTAGNFTTLQQLVRSYATIAAKIEKGHDSRLYQLFSASPGDPVIQSRLNEILFGVYNELAYLFEAVRGTEQVVEEDFNLATSHIERLRSDLKYCRQQLSAYSIYATRYGDDLYVGESFCREDNIDRGSALLSGEECAIDLESGTVSLPYQSDDRWPVEKVEIGELSNGALGNNSEAGAPVRGSILNLSDGNADTWTEYERVVSREDEDGLRLELKICLKSINPINGITLDPVFLGARTPPVIEALEISQDGNEWLSLENDVRVAEFLDEAPEERFHLSPHSSKFSGRFSASFAPRYGKFVRLLISQSSAFPITDVYGRRQLRYAIGIREISICGYKYATTGHLVSKPLPFSRSISLAGIEALVDPPLLPAEVGGAKYFLSANDGASWTQITSIEDASTEVQEIIPLPEGTSSLRYRVELYKDESVFSRIAPKIGAIPFREIYPLGQRRPIDVSLAKVPVDGTLTICKPSVAFRGDVYSRVLLGRGVESRLDTNTFGMEYRRWGNTQHRVKIPLSNIKKPEELHIYVNNERWTRVASVADFATVSSHEYVLSQIASDTILGSPMMEAIFGNASPTSPLGAIPSPVDEISLFLSTEVASAEGLAAPYIVNLDYSSDGDKEKTKITFVGGVYSPPRETISSGVTRFKLKYKNIYLGTVGGVTHYIRINRVGSDGTWQSVVTNGSASYKTFVDGYTEIPTAGDWTVDLSNGVLYLKTPTGTSEETSISYSYIKAIELENDDWDFVEGDLGKIQIYESGYHNEEEEASISAGVRVLDLYTASSGWVTGVVSKSVRVPKAVLGNYDPFEVPFQDGITEFVGRASIQDEEVPATAGVGSPSVASFRLTHWENLVETAGISFSDTTTFISEKANYASLSTTGDYFFDSTGEESAGAGYVYVRCTSIPAGGTVSYQYRDPAIRESMRGAYSVDIKEARVHFAEFTSAADTIKFKHATYFVDYGISEVISPNSYQYDKATNKVSILGEAGSKIAISYKYEPQGADIAGLAPYFSPLLRALAVRAA